jgi:hypothetical protein
MSLTVNEVAKNPCLRNLVDAYTGKVMEVRVVYSGKAGFMFMAPDAYSPSGWQKDMAKLLDEASTRRGMVGAKQGDPHCAYTGAKLALEADPELGFRLVGGWDPAMPVASPEMFAYLARRRDGKEDPSAPKPQPKVESVIKVIGVREAPEPRLPPVAVSDAVGDVAERTVHELRRKAGLKKASVTRK